MRSRNAACSCFNCGAVSLKARLSFLPTSSSRPPSQAQASSGPAWWHSSSIQT
jgi:hypothetical protein